MTEESLFANHRAPSNTEVQGFRLAVWALTNRNHSDNCSVKWINTREAADREKVSIDVIKDSKEYSSIRKSRESNEIQIGSRIYIQKVVASNKRMRHFFCEKSSQPLNAIDLVDQACVTAKKLIRAEGGGL